MQKQEHENLTASSRLIKFRAWNGESGKMVYWTLNDLLVRFNTSDYEGNDKPSVFFNWMQDTGLFDRNGKEIYVDDIVELEYSRMGGGPVSDKIKLQVEIRDGCVMFGDFSGIDIIRNNSRVPSKHPMYLEIIGNIHEHSHLRDTFKDQSEIGVNHLNIELDYLQDRKDTKD